MYRVIRIVYIYLATLVTDMFLTSGYCHITGHTMTPRVAVVCILGGQMLGVQSLH